MIQHLLKKAFRLSLISIIATPYSLFAENQAPEPSTKFLADQSYPDQPALEIAFGSCNKPKKDQEFWHTIKAKNPDVMLLLGDNHYANSRNAEALEKAYDELAAIPQYSEFRQQIATFATWDNHDYGVGYRGRLNSHAKESEQLFLDHFSVPEADARRSRTGIYGSWIFGIKPHRVQVIMLDLQRFRDPIQPGKGTARFTPQPGKTLMGVDQWKWLEQEFKKEAEVRIVGSAIQVLPNDHSWRRWGMFPDERERLLPLINQTTGTTILLSGDRHRGEISVLNPSSQRPLFEVTASSFNHCYPSKETNVLRTGEIVNDPHFGWLNIDWNKNSIEMQLLSAKDSTLLLTKTVKITQ